MTLFLFDSTELKLHTYIILRYFEYYLGLSYVYSTIYMSNTKGGGELFAILPSILLLIKKNMYIYFVSVSCYPRSSQPLERNGSY